MPADVLRLMDRLGVERADLMGYSMGGLISIQLMASHPERFNAVVLGGIGGGSFRGLREAEAIAGVLEAEEAPATADETGRAFRAFAEAGGNDLRALAAVMRARRSAIGPEELSRVAIPVLIVAGAEDLLVGDPRELGRAIPGSEVEVISGRDHLTVVGDRRYKQAALHFLSEHPA
jgi:pimeloyl-ACP methyl ester carboxylesterase